MEIPQRRGLVAGPDFSTFRRRYFTPDEVAEHSYPWDLWVSYLGHVYDLTRLAREFRGDTLLKPILEVAGQDISHWFDPVTKDLRKHTDPLTGCRRYRTPWGRFIHVPPQLPRSDWATNFGLPWWKDMGYRVGRLATRTRDLRIVNTLTGQEHTLQVGTRESLWEILHRYLPYNQHAASYTWKFEGKPLDMARTLEENGIQDEEEDFDFLNMDSSLHTPAILIYFNDDLTEL